MFCVASYNEFHLVTTGTGNLHLQMSYIVSYAALLLLSKFQKFDSLLNVDLEMLLYSLFEILEISLAAIKFNVCVTMNNGLYWKWY